MKNRFVRKGSYVYIILETKSGESYEARISRKDLPKADSFPGRWVAYINPKSRTVYVVGYTSKMGKKNGRIWLHRFLLDIDDPKIDVDHKNHCGLHNNRSNLRPGTHEENLQNKSASKNNKTGVRGVTVYKDKYRATVQSKGKTLLDRIVGSLEEAQELVAKKRKEVFPFAIEKDTLQPNKARFALV